ncbi:MAG: nascent polypeptide-associated complex protein [Nanoarchaeota archaeon]|nr:nascent polypeptide-associated complex protein [Nanoarchaeota archaeon]
MFPGMNAAKMQGMMKKMGISQTPLNVKRVIFEIEEGNLIIDEPSVIRVMMQGQETYQVSGEAREEELKSFSEEDVAMVVEKTGKGENEVREALGMSEGDIAEAIMKLKD